MLATTELSDADSDAEGGITPLPPVEVAVALEPLRVKVMAPEDTIVSTMGVSMGVRTPPLPVEKNVEFAPEMVSVVAVEETTTSSLIEPLVLALTEADTLGGMMPSDLVEKTLVKPSVTVTLPAPPDEGVGVGVTMPSVPVDA